MNIQPISAVPTMNDSDTSLKPVIDAALVPVQENIVFENPPIMTAAVTMNVPAALPASAMGLGAQLAAKREAMRLSVDQVAMQLNLATRQIKALEADNFAALPGMASVRGFVRSYAKLLKIAPEPLLAMLGSPTDTPLTEAVSTRRALSAPFFGNSRIPIMGSQGRNKKKRWLIPLVLFLLLALFGAYKMGWLMPLPGFSKQKTALESETKAVEGEMKAQASLSSTPLEPIALPASALSNPATAAPVPATEASGNVPAAASNIALLIKYREDSWIDLRRNDGNSRNSVIKAHVGKAGTTESYDQADARSLTIGNAKGVDVFLYGAPVDLKTNANGNVVRINLQ
jgi:cytoskeleton protein RodZ